MFYSATIRPTTQPERIRSVTIPDSVDLLAGVPLMVVVPALVELAKRQGMPTRYAGLASIAFTTLLLALAGFALDPHLEAADPARWLVGGIVYGLAAAGLYSQRATLTRSTSGDSQSPVS
jgi:hypothetical protein